MINFTKLLKIGLPVTTLTAATIITATLLFSKREDNKDNDENKDKVLDDFEKPLELYQEEIINKPESEAEKEPEDDKKELDENQQKAKEKIEEQLQKESDKKQLIDDLLNRPDELIKKLSLDDKLPQGQLKEIVSKIPGLEEELSKAEQEASEAKEGQGAPLESQSQDLGVKDPSIRSEDHAPDQPNGTENEEVPSKSPTMEETQGLQEEPEDTLGAEEQDLPTPPIVPEEKPRAEEDELENGEDFGQEESIDEVALPSESNPDQRDKDLSSDSEGKEMPEEGESSGPSSEERQATDDLDSSLGEPKGGAEDGQEAGEGAADSMTEEILREMEEITERASGAISYLQNLLGRSGLR